MNASTNIVSKPNRIMASAEKLPSLWGMWIAIDAAYADSSDNPHHE
jgi:hypothetical protein